MNVPMMPMGFGGATDKGGFGSDWIAFLIIALIFGWGGNGSGFGGRNGVAGTDNLISNEFNFSSLDNGIRGLERGICDLGYAGAQQGSQTRETVNALGSNLTTTLMGLGSQMVSQGELTRGAITSAAFENERGLAGLSAQMASCLVA